MLHVFSISSVYKKTILNLKIQNNTNWEDFQKCLNEGLSRNNLPVNSNDMNIMWETWKTNINKAATNAFSGPAFCTACFRFAARFTQ
jgi:hypothetical protein